MGGLPDPEWYFEHVLNSARPGVADLDVGQAARWRAWWSGQVGDDELHARAAAHGFVLTTAELAALGVPRSAVRTRCRRGIWTNVGRGVVAPLALGDAAIDGGVPDLRRRRHALLCSAAAACRPSHVVCDTSAAILHGLPTMAVPSAAQLTDSHSTGPGRRAGRHIRRAALPASDIERWFGVPITTVARTLVDLGRHDRRNAVMAADQALREGLVSRAMIQSALNGARGWPGVRQARSVLALADPLAESPLESILRLALCDDGFPCPQLQYRIGAWRVDLCWPDARLVVEADGRTKYSADELWREKRREHDVRQLGYRVERVLWSDVTRDWPRTSARLRTALGIR